MKVLGLDISTSAGWAFLEDAQLVSFGHIGLKKTVHEYGSYPWNYLDAANEMATLLFEKVQVINPDMIVIEETNLGKSRYSQKLLEFIHLSLMSRLSIWRDMRPGRSVVYLSSSTWRQALGLQMSKEDKRNNAKLSKAKKIATESGAKLDKKALGVRGKINKKHLALRYVNETYGLNLKVKDNDAADAICLGAAFLRGAEPCDGVM
jgi:hypothetical protein